MKSWILSSASGARYFIASALAILILSHVLSPAANAVDVPGLFTAEVQMDEESDNPRRDADKAALRAVLARISGSRLSDDEELIEYLFPAPGDFVTQFRPGAEETLVISFDGEAIERVLRSSGQAVWGPDRPLTLVWLAVDWGQGEREIIAAGEPDEISQQARSIDPNQMLRERVLEIAATRGLPLAFPLLDTIDLQSVTFSDIWGGFDEQIVAASRRYGASSILIGRVRPMPNQRNRWTYVFGGETRTWEGSAEAVVGQVADMLIDEFAVGGDAPLETHTLNVSGIQTLDAYGSLQNLLADLSLIEEIRMSEVSGDVVSYEVDVRGGEERLRRALGFAGLLELADTRESGDLDGGYALEFFYSSQ